MHIKWGLPTPAARDADEGDSTLALTAATSAAASSVVTTPAPELPVGITSSTTSTATPPIVADNWGRLFAQPAHILEESDLESAEPSAAALVVPTTAPVPPASALVALAPSSSIAPAAAQSAAASATTSPVNAATTLVATAPISEEDFESAALLCDVHDQAPPRRVMATTTSSQASSTSPSTTSPAATMPASVALTPVSSDAISVARMRDEVDQQQVPAASPRWPRPTMPASPCSVPPFSSRNLSPPRRSVSGAEDRAASGLRILEEGNKALKQELAKREGELQLVQMQYDDEACKLTVVQRQLKESTEDTVPRNMPDKCLMDCLTVISSCFSLPFSYSWDAVICWQHRPWPPPSGRQSESCEAELRPLLWPLFDMVERYSVMSVSRRLWKPPWFVSSQQHISLVLPEPVVLWRCLMTPGRLDVITVLVGICLLDSQIKIIVSLIFWNHTHIILVFVDTRTEALKLFCQMDFQLTAPWPSHLSCCQNFASQTARPCFISWQFFNYGLADGQLRQPWPPPAVALVLDIVMQQSKPWSSFCFHRCQVGVLDLHLTFQKRVLQLLTLSLLEILAAENMFFLLKKTEYTLLWPQLNKDIDMWFIPEILGETILMNVAFILSTYSWCEELSPCEEKCRFISSLTVADAVGVLLVTYASHQVLAKWSPSTSGEFELLIQPWSPSALLSYWCMFVLGRAVQFMWHSCQLYLEGSQNQDSSSRYSSDTRWNTVERPGAGGDPYGLDGYISLDCLLDRDKGLSWVTALWLHWKGVILWKWGDAIGMGFKLKNKQELIMIINYWRFSLCIIHFYHQAVDDP